MTAWATASAAQIASAVLRGEVTARGVAEACLEQVNQLNPTLNAFTEITRERALATADAVDGAIARGDSPGPLAGVPFAVKNLFDVKGVPTVAGSKINQAHPPAASDATLVDRLEAAGAVLVGALNMGEYAYDFTGQNSHYGASRNPHNPDHMSGGSSGGSGTAVAAGMVPLALGSDTNGSIRVPSSFCGLFGLKPTYGRLSRAGTFPFVASLDHVGPFARSVEDLAVSYDVMSGGDPNDPVCKALPKDSATSTLDGGIEGLRMARLGGFFTEMGLPEAFEAVDRVASALDVTDIAELEDAATARVAAYLITMAEGASLHLDRLKSEHRNFDPDVRDRLIAGAMVPGAWVTKAQKVRREFQRRAYALFETFDVLLAPATPCRAPKIGQVTMVLDGVEMPVRPNLGLFTQPISFIGLPVVTVPVWALGEDLPIGVQIIAPPWKEAIALRVARYLEEQAIVTAPVAG